MSSDNEFDDIYGDEEKPVVEKKPVEAETAKETAKPAAIDSSANEQLAALQALTSSLAAQETVKQETSAPKETSVPIPQESKPVAAQETSVIASPPVSQDAVRPRADLTKDITKLFIGGLNWDTDEEKLSNYFSKYGRVVDLKIMRDNATGRSRGFGFLTFDSPGAVDAVVQTQHVLDGKVIDPKRAIPRDEQDKTGKIFVGGIGADVRPKEFEQFFAQYGAIIDAQLMLDKDTGRSRGYGFVTYDSPDAVDRVCRNKYIEFKGKRMEIKRAEPRNMQRGGRGQRSQGPGSSPAPMSAQQPQQPMFNPQMMQDYYQKMQEYYSQFQNGMPGMQMPGMQMPGMPPMPQGQPGMPPMPQMPGMPPMPQGQSGMPQGQQPHGHSRRPHQRRQNDNGYHPYK